MLQQVHAALAPVARASEGPGLPAGQAQPATVQGLAWLERDLAGVMDDRILACRQWHRTDTLSRVTCASRRYRVTICLGPVAPAVSEMRVAWTPRVKHLWLNQGGLGLKSGIKRLWQFFFD